VRVPFLKGLTMKRQEIAGKIEEVVGQARLVDAGLRTMRNWLHNTPSFDPDRRRFFEVAATLAGTLVLDQVLSGCAGPEATRTGGLFPSRDWRDVLMEGDMIYGPKLLVELGRERDFEAHRSDPMPYYGVDYDVPKGTPITQALSGWTWKTEDVHGGLMAGTDLRWRTPELLRFTIQYKHLSGFEDKMIGKDIRLFVETSG
jgi:hypothetical protein